MFLTSLALSLRNSSYLAVSRFFSKRDIAILCKLVFPVLPTLNQQKHVSRVSVFALALNHIYKQRQNGSRLTHREAASVPNIMPSSSLRVAHLWQCYLCITAQSLLKLCDVPCTRLYCVPLTVIFSICSFTFPF